MARNTELRDKATRQFRALMASKQPAREIQRAVLGDGSGNIRVSDRPDLVYVRLKAKGDALWKVLNDKVTDVENLPVLIEKRPVGDIWEVIDVDKSGLLYTDGGWENVTYNQNHASLHEWPDYAPGPDPVNIYPRAVVPLRCYATYQGGLLVDVAPLRYSYAGELKRFDGTTMDVSEYQPSAGQQRNILTYLDPTDNVMKVVTANPTTYSAAIVPPLPSIPEYAIPSAVIRLWERNYVTEQDITDYRLLLDKVVPGGSNTLADFDLTDASDDQVLTYTNEAWRNKSLYDAKIASYTPGYLVTTYTDDLPNERIFKAIPGEGLRTVDAGANAEFEAGLDFAGLPLATTYADADELAILQGGVHKRIATSNIIPPPGAGGGGGAPTDAQYLVLSYNGDLTAERLLKPAPGEGLKGTDAGANAEYEFAFDFPSLPAVTTYENTDEFAIVQSGVHRRIPASVVVPPTGWKPGNTIVVSQSGDGDFLTIAEGLAAASAGDTVLIDVGNYSESVTVPDQVNLRGVDRTNCVISQSTEDYTLLFESGGTNYVKELKVRNDRGTGTYGAVYVPSGSPNLTMRNVEMYAYNGTGRGISTAHTGGKVQLYDCDITGSSAAIYHTGANLFVYGGRLDSDVAAVDDVGSSATPRLQFVFVENGTFDADADDSWYFDPTYVFTSSGADLRIDKDGLIEMDEYAGTPTTPAGGNWGFYFKSDGAYVIDDAGSETGPLGTGGGAGDDTLVWLTGAL